VVAGAATGGIVLAQWIAYNSVHIAKQGAEIHAVYADKRDGGLRFRDSYASLLRGKLVLAAEDIINSGHSLRLLIKEIQRCGGIVIGAAALWNRGDPLTAAMLDVPEFHCLLGEPLVSWPAETCPLCASGEIPLNLEVGHGQEYLNYLATKS
jgi:orotate phosphoribosyltransferase